MVRVAHFLAGLAAFFAFLAVFFAFLGLAALVVFLDTLGAATFLGAAGAAAATLRAKNNCQIHPE